MFTQHGQDSAHALELLSFELQPEHHLRPTRACLLMAYTQAAFRVCTSGGNLVELIQVKGKASRRAV
jgi:hypothetical protein